MSTRGPLSDLEPELNPPVSLRSRVIESLRREGILRRRVPAGWRVGGLIAAGIMLFLAGMLVDRWGESAQPAPSGRYLLLLYEGEDFNPPAGRDLAAEYGGWARDLRKKGEMEMGEELDREEALLGPSASTASSAGRVAGFFVIRAGSAEAAAAVARTCPHLRYGGRIAVRPIVST
jgi:hypothetical protein